MAHRGARATADSEVHFGSLMLERPPAGQRAVLVHLEFPGVDYDADRDEFVELAASAGAEQLGLVGGKRQRPDAGLFAGSGKVDEIAELVRAHGAELALFNHDLSPSQERNLETRLQCRVLDRAGLILDIFAQRARSHEGKLQVELAQLEHLATRLVRGWSHLERQKGGIGLRGPGESQLETDRRLLRKRIQTLKSRLEVVRKRRAQSRNARTRNEIPTVSLVGYTNAGKSTLFNALTGNDTFASSQLFATLDPTLRRLPLPPGEHIVLADTVGFVRDLPHELVAAFRATLEETRDASLLLHVVDAADPDRRARIEQVEAVLEEIDATDKPRIVIYNKVDLCEDEPVRVDHNADGEVTRIFVSAHTGDGLDALRQVVRDYCYADMMETQLRLPPSAGQVRAQLFAQHAVLDETCEDDGTLCLSVRIPWHLLRTICSAAGLAVPPAPSPVSGVHLAADRGRP